MSDKISLRALRELHEKATPGPWRVSRVGDEPHMRIESETQGLQITAYLNSIPAQGANMALIAATRNAIPALLAIAEAAREYFTKYAEDEADDPTVCIDPYQYDTARALRAALALVEE